LSDKMPRVPGQGKMGPAPMTPNRRDDSNSKREPRANKPECGTGDFKSGTSGRKTWPSLPK
jgi:hypothetical protein